MVPAFPCLVGGHNGGLISRNGVPLAREVYEWLLCSCHCDDSDYVSPELWFFSSRFFVGHAEMYSMLHTVRW